MCNWLDQNAGSRGILSYQLIRSGTSIGANLYEGKICGELSAFMLKVMQILYIN
ncbi:MAG: hypothetical protein AAGF83_00325 [Cyanobacteria bacterium P01_G01_bin.67]